MRTQRRGLVAMLITRQCMDCNLAGAVARSVLWVGGVSFSRLGRMSCGGISLGSTHTHTHTPGTWLWWREHGDWGNGEKRDGEKRNGDRSDGEGRDGAREGETVPVTA